MVRMEVKGNLRVTPSEAEGVDGLSTQMNCLLGMFN